MAPSAAPPKPAIPPQASETTPLLSSPSPTSSPSLPRPSLFSPFNRLLLTALLCAISFVYTATPLIYAFRTITCDIYYDTPGHVPWEGGPPGTDRCSVRPVESGAAEGISLMAALTTISGVLNLLTTGVLIKTFGVKVAMISQTFWPCLRNMCQIFAIYHGGVLGIQILQWTQLITIMGGGAGFFLTANTYVAALVSAEARTSSFGIMQGIAMLGTAIGFTVGGLTGDIFGAPAPFEVTLCLLILSTLLSTFFLPYVAPPGPTPPPAATSSSSTSDQIKPKSTSSMFSFLSPLRIFIPRKIEGVKGRYWGVSLLGLGCFLGVLALAYVPLLLQLTATNRYGFHPTENGYLMSSHSLIRALFLTFVFPRIISRGRKWYTTSPTPTPSSSTPTQIPTSPTSFEPLPIEADSTTEPPLPPPPTDEVHGSGFDLVFLRWSMVLDGILTGLAAGASKGWHMYLAACVIPLASGTAAASKGVVMELVLPSEQSDALAAIALSETLATVLTVTVFGMIFAQLSDRGLAEWTFVLNAGLAMVAAAVLYFVRFPKTTKDGQEV